MVFEGDWQQTEVITEAAKYYAPVRCVISGRGKGKLPFEGSLMAIDNSNIHVTCVKRSEDGTGLIIRCFNPREETVTCRFSFGCNLVAAYYCKMDEQVIAKADLEGNKLICQIPMKKIMTIRVLTC